MAASKITLLGIFLSASIFLYGQSANDDQKITISFNNELLQEALLRLDEISDHQLSYNPKVLPPGVVLNQSFESKGTETILKEILGHTLELKQIGNYIIIQKAEPAKKKKAAFQIKGGIQDAATGEELKDVSIYEVNSLQSTLSNAKGEFTLEAETHFEEATFVISKRFYQDTVIRVSQLRTLDSPITLKEEKITKTRRSIRERVSVLPSRLAKFFTSDKSRKNAQNVNFVDTRPFQLSLVPSIGTNRGLSGQVKNRFSLNLMAGYAYGVRGVEIGGIYNIDREEVRGIQFGGFGNTVGGEVHGLQAGGFINTTKDYVNGAQIAGFINVASDSVNGFQMGGFTNVTKEMRGLQIAGFNNHTRSMKGSQWAGFINTTKRMDGLQIAGFMNVAKEVRGVQFSLVNITDSVASGVQLGFVNISKKNGFISPALESDDVVPYRLSFRSGLDRFYSVLSAGIRGDEYWSYGVGFGSRLFLFNSPAFFINPELRWFNLSEGRGREDENNYLFRFNFNLGYQVFKRLSITTGPSLNFYSTNHLDESGMPVIDIASSPILDRSSGSSRHQLWIGYTVGIGF